jgi:hypothetical protein
MRAHFVANVTCAHEDKYREHPSFLCWELFHCLGAFPVTFATNPVRAVLRCLDKLSKRLSGRNAPLRAVRAIIPQERYSKMGVGI